MRTAFSIPMRRSTVLRTEVPTVQSEGAEKQKALKNFCAKQYPMEERDGLLWLWHGRVPFPLHAAPEALHAPMLVLTPSRGERPQAERSC